MEEKKLNDMKLRESEARYRSLFENSPVALWEADSSRLKNCLDRLRNSGHNLDEYFNKYPQKLAECLRLIRITAVNRAAINLYQAKSQEELLKDQSWLLTPNSYRGLQDGIIAINSGQAYYEFETDNRTKNGEKIQVQVKLSRIPEIKGLPYKILISVINITKNKEMLEKLKKSEARYRALSNHLEKIWEEERKSLSREIHDELGQSLTALKIDLFWLEKKLSQGQPELQEKIKGMSRIVDSINSSLRRISTQLRPEILDDLGLLVAIEWQVREFRKLTGIMVETSIKPNKMILNQKLSVTIFRVIQEALTNIARHSEAKKARIKLWKKGKELILKVIDGGKGIDTASGFNPDSFGLVGIQERIAAWKGSFKIRGMKNIGTGILIIIPLGKEAKKND